MSESAVAAAAAAATAAGTAARAEAQPVNLAGISASIMLPTIMQALDSTIANVALPHMQGSFSASQDQIAWVLTSYIVAAAIMTPPTGFLAGRFGRKRVFLAAVFGFTIASMLCGMATSLTQIVLFRLLQGVCGASLVPLSQSVLLDSFPRERHGSAMALWGLGVMVGPILGPTLGGYLTENYNWRWVFYINLPVGVLAFLLISAFVPETERIRRRFDIFGFAMLSLAIGSLQIMLDRGENRDWFGSTEIVVEGALAALGLYLFVVQTVTADRPFIDPRLFRDRNFVGSLVCAFAVGVVLFATMALMPPFLQGLMDYPVVTVGYVLAPRGIGTMIAMLAVGRLISRTDPRYLMLFGFSLTAVSLWQMSNFTTDITPRILVETGIVQGIGLGFVFVPLSTIAFSTLPPHFRTEAAGMFNLIRNIGSSIGISICFALVAINTQINHSVMAERVSRFNPLFQAPSVPEAWDPATSAGAMSLDHVLNAQAQVISYLNDFRMMMWMMIVALPMVLLLQRPRYAPPPDAVAVPD
ncbi:MAG TPA: DHA2 family efflux MFS transporter permease subunit [Candidatus Cybelea sp.]|nr:DHA2 family efflux MFS transporter permease subunit [Candidatus Cybelea sp.]